MKSRRVPCGRRSSVLAMIELGEVQRRTSCVGVLDEFDEDQPKVENFRRGSSLNVRTTGGVGEALQRRKSNVGVLAKDESNTYATRQSNTTATLQRNINATLQNNTNAGEIEEDRDNTQEDSRMIQNWEDQ